MQDFSAHDVVLRGDPLYLHGGPVCCITEVAEDSKKKTLDYMVCDKDFCDECGDNTYMLKPSLTNGLPFVHSCETIRPEKNKFLFRRREHGKLEVVGGGWQRDVHFETEEGLKKFRVQTCVHRGCEVCENDRP